MATEPKRDPIKRVAVFVELESGATLAVYSHPDPHKNDAELELKREEVQLVTPWTDGPRMGRRIDASIHVDGLHEYRATESMPAMVRATLDSIASAVTL